MTHDHRDASDPEIAVPDNQKRKLDDFRIDLLPAEAYYIPDFISSEEETLILSKVWPS